MSERFADLALVDDLPPADEFEQLVDPSFDPIDLGPVLAGDVAQPMPFVLTREDGQSLFYEAMINGIHGDSGVGKSWIGLFAVTQQLRRGHTVMLIDTEDTEQSIVARLRILGARDDEIATRLVYVRPQAEFGPFAVHQLVALAEDRDVTLVVVDSLGECFGLDGIDENSDAEVGPWLRRVARRLAEAGPAVVLVDHSTKAKDNPLFASGSKRKRAALGGASYLVTATQPLALGRPGRLRLVCAKDRHGTYATNEHVADFVMEPTPQGTTAVRLWPGNDAAAEPTLELAVRAAVRAVSDATSPMSQNLLLERMTETFKSRKDTKCAAIDLAVERGLIVESSGPRNARLFALGIVSAGSE